MYGRVCVCGCMCYMCKIIYKYYTYNKYIHTPLYETCNIEYLTGPKVGLKFCKVKIVSCDCVVQFRNYI